jgi:tRNA pseudouridine65 synthase
MPDGSANFDPVTDPIRILHRDGHLVAVAKPAGMLVHRGMGASRDETFLLQAVRDLVGAYVHPIHRLDRPTEGIVVFALDPASARTLQEGWQTGSVRKSYRAIVRGWLSTPEGIRDEALDSPDNGALQDARTRWRSLATMSLPWPCGPHPGLRLSLLELEPLTGRWHQLRRHLSRMGHPIAGDTTHGDRHVNHLLRDRLGWWRLHLEATTLELPHPATGRLLHLEASPGGVGTVDQLWDALAKEASAAQSDRGA